MLSNGMVIISAQDNVDMLHSQVNMEVETYYTIGYVSINYP